MKKILIATVALVAASFTGYSQFSEKGYKGFKLGMPMEDARKIVKFTDDEGLAVFKYDGLEFSASFIEQEGTVLWYITSTSPDAKVEGISQTLIGKSSKEVRAILGDKMEAMELEGPSTAYFNYYKDAKARKDDMKSCVLYFNEKGMLESISASYNP